MRMKTPEQLKGAIKNIAKDKKLKPQEVLQMFLFERIVERLSLSRYEQQNNLRWIRFVWKTDIIGGRIRRKETYK